MYKISSKLVHAFGLQTPITAECSMRHCQATAVAVATASGRTCRELDGMRPPKFRHNRSIGRQIMALGKYFPKWRSSAEFKKKLIFDHVTVTEVLLCCCVPNFIKIGSRVRLPDVHNCRMFNASLLGNGRCHGNRIVGDMSGT